MNYSYNVVVSTETSEDDGKLSTGEVVGIVLGSIFGFAIIVFIVFLVVCSILKRNNRHEVRQEVSTGAQGEDHAEQENSQECQLHIADV